MYFSRHIILGRLYKQPIFLSRQASRRSASITSLSRPSRNGPILFGAIVGLGGLGWTVDKYFFAEAIGRTVRLAYNAAIIVLDYKLNFGPDVSPDALHERVAARISSTCIQNGGLYIKLGQSIAIQAAILPKPFKIAFENMFDAAKPLPFGDILKVWNKEFNFKLEDMFEEFDSQPIASGSIAQVHRAKLKDSGQVVAVKIQRPDIPIQMELDLFAYRALLYVYEKVFELPMYFIADYVCNQIRQETDFISEARNSERTKHLFDSDHELRGKIDVPKVHWPLTTQRILTTDFVQDGCRLTDESKFEKKGLKSKDVMDLAMKMFSRMLFNFGWLHCDLHPGNVLVIEKGGKPQLALIDHGLYINLPDKFRREYCELWRSLFVLDIRSIEGIAKGWGIANTDLFASATLLKPFQISMSPTSNDKKLKPKISAYESSLKIKETMKTLLENEALIPQELIFIVRCMRMMQGNNQALGSPTNRINILAHAAAAGMRINAPQADFNPNTAITTMLKVWMVNFVHVWTLKLTLFFVDLGFLITQVRQWWLKAVRRQTRGEGFEDLLEHQLENFAKEEFGVSLNDNAFTG
ncbi:hypothetical protein O181_032894 [Austropuccinia psidii MF-1]|uniref:Protein kinase domain-containing protein n=1 Tax=Austropuccinia psidii MF-1 TaxID=1389203 RepID=A0A9Q3H800_9BASI|nr:hypothetical protein [Austropuccinia psidii MF-1]